MKKIVFLFPLAFFACTNPGSDITSTNNTGEGSDKIIELNNKVRSLEQELSEKDASLNEFISTYNEIQDNLAMINLKEDEIRIRSNNTEMGEDGKQWILQEIKNINYLREENENKIKILQGELKKTKNANSELNKANEKLNEMVSRLQRQILNQEEQIKSLQQQLDDLDAEYTELFDAYQEQYELAMDVMKELNQVYYAYGSLTELKDNRVLVDKGGFLRVGKTNMLKEDFNEDYFTPIDMYKKTEIPVVGSKIKLATDHPSSSYTIEGEGDNKKIVINDPTAFWKVSKYLVVVVR